jgi:type I restriction enzyme S subunit
MEVKPGYKQTEVGVIPEEWDVRTIRDASDVVTVGFVGTMAHLFTKVGVPLLRGQNVLPGQLDLTDSKFISPETHSRWKKSALRGGDVVIVRVGYPGTCAVIPQDFGPANAASLVVVRPDSSCVDSSFLCYVLLSDIGRKQVDSALVGGAQQVINIGTAASFLIPVPPKAEQHTISEALSNADALLGGLDRLIAKKRDLKQAAMQQLLSGQTRLPGFDGEWEDTPLGAIGECIIGLTYKPENVVDHGLLVLRSSNIQNGRLAFDDNVYVNIEVANHLTTRPGDLLVCVRNGSRALIGKSAVIDESAAGLTFGAFMSVYRTKHWRFISHAFQSHDIQRQIRDNIGATINQITNKDMRALRVKLPPENEQTTIAEMLTEMDAELAALEQRREKTCALKQGMMQELLTGRTRLV